MPPTSRERILGCLLGGAVGDALGAPIEFMSLAEIRDTFGLDGLGSYAPAYGRLGAITDDTQMTLWTAEGLLRAESRMRDRGICNPVDVIQRAYYRWLQTQDYQRMEQEPSTEDRSGWLIQQAFLHDRRAPGLTCVRALVVNANNDSKGCGGVMRVAPIGLVARDPFGLAVQAAALTHGHPTGSIAAGAFAQIISLIVQEGSLDEAVETTLKTLAEHENHDETTAAIEAARSLAKSAPPTPENVERLGQGWIAEEALGISLYCALTASDFRTGVLRAVNHSGDSDSTGSITGNLLGALHGIDAIPSDLLAELEGRDVIEQIAADLTSVFLEGGAIDIERYPTW